MRAADAHDAGGLAGLGKKQGQLMVTMLAVLWGAGKIRASDAHDAGRFAGLGKK